jgi:uncharacterized protein YbbC (DUF1343 family)
MKRYIIGIMMLCTHMLQAKEAGTAISRPTGSYTIGLDNLNDPIWQQLAMQAKDALSIGLITNQTGKNAAGKRTVDVLLSRGIVIRCMFAPEHGIEGTVSAEKEVHDIIDAATNIPVISLYGKGTGKHLAAHHLKELDLLIFDMQDCGMRHYTYISTLLHCMEMASKHDIPFMVLDRPNPLGVRMEGPVCDAKTKSFIAAAPIPLRHGMTIGELALYFNTYILDKKVDLHVVSLYKYERTMPLTDTLFMPLSPNIPSLNACYGYSFLGLMGEVRPFDCGLGTDHPMGCLGLSADVAFPDAQWKTLQKSLAQSGLQSEFFRYYSPRKKKMCRGLQFALQDINAIASYEVLLKTLKFFKEQGLKLTFSQYFDVAVGTHLVREYAQGTTSKQQLDTEVAQKLAQFNAQAQNVYLYKPWPKI